MFPFLDWSDVFHGVKVGALAGPLHGAVCSLLEPTPTGPASDVNPAQMTVQLGLPGPLPPIVGPLPGQSCSGLSVGLVGLCQVCVQSDSPLPNPVPASRRLHTSSPMGSWLHPSLSASGPGPPPGLCALCCTSHAPSSPKRALLLETAGHFVLDAVIQNNLTPGWLTALHSVLSEALTMCLPALKVLGPPCLWLSRTAACFLPFLFSFQCGHGAHWKSTGAHSLASVSSLRPY